MNTPRFLTRPPTSLHAAILAVLMLPFLIAATYKSAIPVSSDENTTFISAALQGSDTVTLTAAAATPVLQIAVPQTAGANYADARVDWIVYATDGTDSQLVRGATLLQAVNKAGTETCTVLDMAGPGEAFSTGTLPCTTSCITGLTDVVQFALSCESTLTETTLKAQVSAASLQINTVTLQ